MTNLTDKWKKGELPEGWYYVKCNRAEGIYAYTAEYLNNMYRPRNSERIVEQVPSYEEWQAKLEENTKLKELVKELRKALQKETPALRVENAKLKTKVFLIKGLLDKWLPEFDCYNDTLTSQFCRKARELLGE